MVNGQPTSKARLTAKAEGEAKISPPEGNGTGKLRGKDVKVDDFFGGGLMWIFFLGIKGLFGGIFFWGDWFPQNHVFFEGGVGLV